MAARRQLWIGAAVTVAAAAVLSGLFVAGTAAADLPDGDTSSVASLGLCADQVVLALVPRQRIVGVSTDAHNPRLSAVAERARGIPALPASAEAVLATGAQTVVADRHGAHQTLALLERLGVRIVRVPSAENFDEVVDTLRVVARELNAEARAEALIADLGARVRRLESSRPMRALRAAYLRPDGGSAGAGTAVDWAMSMGGFANRAAEDGQRGWVRPRVESLVLDPPAAIVTSYFQAPGSPVGGMPSRDRLLRRLFGTIPTIEVPGRLWSCGGWPLVEAAERLASARAGLEGR